MWRIDGRKGGYSRLLAKEEALLARCHFYYSDEPGRMASVPSPVRPLAQHWDFIEVCGGVGGVSKQMHNLGFVVGPVLGWLISLSPRALPLALLPTLLGNRLAFRALALLLVNRPLRAASPIQDGLASPVAPAPGFAQGLRDLDRLLCFWLATPEGIPVNGDFHEVHRKCSRDHTHARIKGSLTKGSAVYTEGLCRALALTFASHLRRTHHAHEARRRWPRVTARQ